MELCLGFGIFAVLAGMVMGAIFAIAEREVFNFFTGAIVGLGLFIIFAFFGIAIGPMEEESIASPETRIEIVSPEGEVTFFDEGDIKIQEITDDFVKYEEDGEKITIYIEDGSKVKVIDLEE